MERKRVLKLALWSIGALWIAALLVSLAGHVGLGLFPRMDPPGVVSDGRRSVSQRRADSAAYADMVQARDEAHRCLSRWGAQACDCTWEARIFGARYRRVRPVDLSPEHRRAYRDAGVLLSQCGGRR